jgi:hypothetical protein
MGFPTFSLLLAKEKTSFDLDPQMMNLDRCMLILFFVQKILAQFGPCYVLPLISQD